VDTDIETSFFFSFGFEELEQSYKKSCGRGAFGILDREGEDEYLIIEWI
jgi:hypothetical protein